MGDIGDFGRRFHNMTIILCSRLGITTKIDTGISKGYIQYVKKFQSYSKRKTGVI